jgi:dTMP kinase
LALFISLEGGEGSGKTTQVERLSDALAKLGVSTLKIHEPGYTELGDHIRYLIKSKPWGGVTISPTAELFLFAASRGELVSKVLTRKVKDPRLVIIADRYADSTIAYQGYGRRLPLELVNATNRLATNRLMPHKTFLLDLTPEEGLSRAGSVQRKFSEADQGGRLDEEGSRRFEEEPRNFHERVRRGYLALAKDEPDRWMIVDATQSEDSVFESIWGHLQELDEFRELLAPVEYTGGVPDDDPLQSSLFPVTNRNAS